ncbi:carboxypeptidase Y-deficient [Coemansia sp. BCRC 34301]|nr:carboxypeptidase Y-deficient [Coemansia sp. BCRC 34301]
MSQADSRLLKEGSVRHVRRAARTLGTGTTAPLVSNSGTDANVPRRSTISSFDAPTLSCPICGVSAGTLLLLNMHLDEMHFGDEGAARPGVGTVAQQDDMDDIKGAILGFFRGAGRAVRGVGSEEGRTLGGRVRVADDGPGAERSLTTVFVQLRRAAVSAARLEDNRVERRIERLILAHQGGAQTAAEVMAAEQRVVAWEPDHAHHNCPLCARRFGRLAVRRHHCRVCGRVTCGSCTVHLHTAGAELRVCLDCDRTVARMRTRHAMRLAADDSPLKQLYEDMRGGMADADVLLPGFNVMLAKVRGGIGGQAEAARAAAVRRKLTAAFACADRASKAIAALPAASPTAARLHGAVRRAAVQYLQTHMFTLSMLPSRQSAVSLPATPTPVSREASIDQPVSYATTNSSLSQEDKLTSLEVLRDQRQRVLGYIAQAQKERRLEDAISLQASLADLDEELSSIERNM